MPLTENMKPSQPTTEDVKSIVEAFKEVVNVPSVKQSILMKSRKRPRGWRPTSNSPYYKERFGLEFKAVLDAMMVDSKDREYRYKDFTTMSHKSLYLRVNQSKLYLLEELDPDKQYARFCEMTTITRETTGIRISLCRDMREGAPSFVPSIVESDDSYLWKDSMQDFLNDPEKRGVWEQCNLSLSQDEIDTWSLSLNGLAGIAAIVRSDKIKIVKE